MAMFEHLDDQTEPNVGALELARVLNRAGTIQTRRRWFAVLTVSCVLLIAAIGALLSQPFDTPASTLSNYQFNLAKGPLPLGSPVPTTALVDVQFANGQAGYALALHRNEVVLAASGDGGSTWTVRNTDLPAGLGPGAGYPGQFEFVGSIGYLWGASSATGAPLWVSDDAGASWHKAPIGPYVYDASAIGLNVWALYGTCSSSYAASTSCSVNVEQSVDGGTSWSSLGAIASGEPVGGRSIELARITTSRSYVLENVTNASDTANWMLAFTNDGGGSWNTRPAPCNGAFSNGAEVAASSSDDLWLLCGSQATAGEQSKQLYRSGDGGGTWRLVASATGLGTPPPSSVPTDPLPLSGYIAPFTVGHHNLAVASPERAWLFPARADLYETQDDGTSWAPVSDLSPAGFADGGLGNISFLNATQGWICEYSVGLWHTSDGMTWHPLGAS